MVRTLNPRVCCAIDNVLIYLGVQISYFYYSSERQEIDRTVLEIVNPSQVGLKVQHKDKDK